MHRAIGACLRQFQHVWDNCGMNRTSVHVFNNLGMYRTTWHVKGNMACIGQLGHVCKLELGHVISAVCMWKCILGTFLDVWKYVGRV